MGFISTLKTGLKVIGLSIEKGAPTLAIGAGVIGMSAACVSVWNEAPKAEKVIKERKEEKGEDLSVAETAKAVAPYTWKPAVLFAVSAALIIAGHKATLKRIAVLSVAYQLAEDRLESYTEAVKKTFGEKKAALANDTMAKDHLRENPLRDTRDVIITGGGDCLCYDSISGRYFYSNIDKIRNAENRVNKLLLTEFAVSINDFYEEIGLPSIKMGEDLGWNQKDLGDIMEITFSSQLTDKGEPCLVLEYSVAPTHWFAD